MRIQTLPAGLAVVLLLAILVSSGCVTGEWGKADVGEILGSGPKTLVVVPRMSKPPRGKALVNFHFPLGGEESFWRSIDSLTGGEGEKMASPGPGTILIFDKTGRLLIRLGEGCLFQHVCDPGEHIFMAWLTRDYSGVVVVRSEVAPNEIYDILVGFSAGLISGGTTSLIPISKNHPKRAKLPKIEARERFGVALNASSPRVADFEAQKREQIARAKQDFLGGAKSHLLLYLRPDDCR